MIIRLLLIGLFSLITSSCVTTTNTYKLNAYNQAGKNLSDNLELIASGSGVYTVRNSLCLTYPGAVIVIKNTKTTKESKYQCSKKTINHTHLFVAPEQINIFNSKYKLTHKDTLKNVAIYEYTTNNESIKKWQTLITLLYEKDVIISPEKWVKIQTVQTLKPQQTHVSATNGYVQVIFKPDTKYDYFEVAVKKSFFIKDCDGLLTYMYSKRYSSNLELKKVILKSQEIFETLKKDNWAPNCFAS